MKVAIFIECYFPFISGVVTHVKTLKDELEKKGNEVMIITADPTAKTHYMKDGILYCPAKGIKKLYGYGVSVPVSLKRMEYIKEFNPDIIHIHTEFTIGIFGMFVAKKLKKPMIYTLHTMYDDYTFYLFPKSMDGISKLASHTYFKSVANRATEIIGPSLKVVEFLKNCGVRRQVNIIPNVIDLSIFLPENVDFNRVQAVKAQYNIKEDDIVLCFVGRLGQEKSVDTLIQYFANISKDNDRYKLLIVGDGPEAKNLKELVSNLDLSHKVFFTGKVQHEHIPDYYYASNLYATASLTEINSISMLEAMASGLMVLQKFDFYNKDQITNGENGYLYQNQNELEKILREYETYSKDKRDEMRKTVSNFSKKYGPSEFIEKVINVYELAIHKYKSNNKK